MQAASGIAVGDKVKILRPAKKGEMGWYGTLDYVQQHTELLGQTLTVNSMTYTEEINWIELKTSTGRTTFAPFFVLEIVEKKKTIRKEIRYYDENNEDITDLISPETKANLV